MGPTRGRYHCGPMQHLRLTHPDLAFWVDVRLSGFDGRWMAVADLAGRPEIGLALDARQAVLEAIRPIGDPYVADMVARLGDPAAGPRERGRDGEV